MVNNQLQVFLYGDKHVRTIVEDGITWFAGKDVANILGYKRTRDALRAHVDNEDKKVRQITAPSNGGYSDVVMINEAGVYSLIFSSKLHEAKKFKNWVTHDVLPSIHQHGMYLTPKVREIYERDPIAFSQLLDRYIDIQNENQNLRIENSTLKIANADLLEHIAREQAFSTLGHVVIAVPGSIPVKDATNVFGQYGIKVGQNSFYALGRNLNLLCKRKGKQWNKPTQKAIEMGIFGLDITDGFNVRTMVTPIGLKYFCGILLRKEYPLLALLG